MVYSTQNVDDLGMVTGWFIYRFCLPQTIDAVGPASGKCSSNFVTRSMWINTKSTEKSPGDPGILQKLPLGGIQPIGYYGSEI